MKKEEKMTTKNKMKDIREEIRKLSDEWYDKTHGGDGLARIEDDEIDALVDLFSDVIDEIVPKELEKLDDGYGYIYKHEPSGNMIQGRKCGYAEGKAINVVIKQIKKRKEELLNG